jgi:hypothetical protein
MMEKTMEMKNLSRNLSWKPETVMVRVEEMKMKHKLLRSQIEAPKRVKK